MSRCAGIEFTAHRWTYMYQHIPQATKNAWGYAIGYCPARSRMRSASSPAVGW